MGTSTLVLAAGSGTRMRSRTPKVLHTLAGRAMIDLVLAAVREADGDPLVVVAKDADALRVHLDGVPTVTQEAPLGTGHAVQVALGRLPQGGRAFLVYGDTPLLRGSTLAAMATAHETAKAALTVLTGDVPPPSPYGRVERDARGNVARVVETKHDPAAQRAVGERNLGAYVVDLAWLREAAPALRRGESGEVYLTDLVELAIRGGRVVAAHRLEDWREGLGVNTRADLATAEAALRDRIRERHLLAGVTLRDPPSTFIDDAVSIGPDTVLLPGTHLEGATRVGAGCVIGPRATVRDSTVGDRCVVGESTIEGATFEDEVSVGPYCHVRPGSYFETGVRLLDHVEVKNSRLGAGTQAHHFCYLGDATIGKGVNVGAGTITANYDGTRKLPTTIGDGVFLGVDTLLVAPVTVGARAKTGAGAVVTKDVPPGMLAVGVPARAIKRVAPAEEPK